MAAESSSSSEVEEENSFLEHLINSRNRDLSSILFPLILGTLGGGGGTEGNRGNEEEEEEEEEEDDDDSVGEIDRIVFINPFTQGMIVVEGADGRRGLDALLRELSANKGTPPASRASIDEMPRVEVKEEGEDCAICLEEMVMGNTAREMPCKHRYHSTCIDKWLGLHGSCPVCRYEIPFVVEEGKKDGLRGEEAYNREEGGGAEEGEGRRNSTSSRRRRRRREIWVSFSVNRRNNSAASTEQSSSSDVAVDD